MATNLKPGDHVKFNSTELDAWEGVVTHVDGGTIAVSWSDGGADVRVRREWEGNLRLTRKAAL